MWKRHAVNGHRCVVGVAALGLALSAGCRTAHHDERRTIGDTNRSAVEVLAYRCDHRAESAAPAPDPNAEDLIPGGILTVQQARRIALRNNPDIHAALARLEVARARIMEARSRYYPSLSFSHRSTRTFHTPANRNRLDSLLAPSATVPTDTESSQYGTDNIALQALINVLRRPLFGVPDLKGNHNPFSEHSTAFATSWTVFDGFVREAQHLSAKHLRKASRFALADTRRLIVHAVDTAFHQIQLAEEQVRVARADQAFSREQLEETQKLRAAHRASQADVDNFKIRELAARARVKHAMGVRDAGKVTLFELLGITEIMGSQSFSLPDLQEETEAAMSKPDRELWVRRAIANRPDLSQLEAIINSLDQQIRAAKGLYSPSLAVSGSWGFDSTSNLRYTAEDQSAAAAVELRWDIFTGGSRRSRVIEARGNRAETAADYHKLRLAILANVERTIIELEDAQEQIRLQRETLETSRENRRVVRAGYVAGKETLNRLNEAHRDFTAADTDLALARVRLRQSWSDLASASAMVCGGLSDTGRVDDGPSE